MFLVTKIENLANSMRVTVRANISGGEYVAGCLKNSKGVQVTEPGDVPGATGVLVSFAASGIDREHALRLFNADPQIAVADSV